MNDELTRKLITRFPVLYQGFYDSIQESAMPWGFSHGAGWFDIIWQLSLAIEDELGYTVRQKRSFLRKKRWSKRWNKLIYWISPVVHNETKLVGKGTKEEPYRQVVVKLAPDADWLISAAKLLFPSRDGDFKSWIGRFQRLGLKVLVWHPDTGHHVDQVKEKFGTLRYYCSGNDRIYRFIHLAEILSSAICETCGKPGKLYTNGWWYTACKEHVRPEDLEPQQEKS
jgi:hypothetical protein